MQAVFKKVIYIYIIKCFRKSKFKWYWARFIIIISIICAIYKIFRYRLTRFFNLRNQITNTTKIILYLLKNLFIVVFVFISRGNLIYFFFFKYTKVYMDENWIKIINKPYLLIFLIIFFYFKTWFSIIDTKKREKKKKQKFETTRDYICTSLVCVWERDRYQ